VAGVMGMAGDPLRLRAVPAQCAEVGAGVQKGVCEKKRSEARLRTRCLNRCGPQLLPQLNLHHVAIEDPGEATVILVLTSEDLDPLPHEVFHNSVDIVDTQVDHKW